MGVEETVGEVQPPNPNRQFKHCQQTGFSCGLLTFGELVVRYDLMYVNSRSVMNLLHSTLCKKSRQIKESGALARRRGSLTRRSRR